MANFNKHENLSFKILVMAFLATVVGLLSYSTGYRIGYDNGYKRGAIAGVKATAEVLNKKLKKFDLKISGLDTFLTNIK